MKPMHRNHYDESKEIDNEGRSFTGLIMSAMTKADPVNREKLRAAFPDVAAELHARNEAPGGVLDDDDLPFPRDGEPNYPAPVYQPDGGVYGGGSAPRVGEMRARDY